MMLLSIVEIKSNLSERGISVAGYASKQVSKLTQSDRRWQKLVKSNLSKTGISIPGYLSKQVTKVIVDQSIDQIQLV